MSLFDVFCSIWRFIARLLRVMVDTAVSLATQIAKASIQLLGDVVKAVTGILDGLLGSGLGGWLLIGGAAYLAFMLLKQRRNDKGDVPVVSETRVFNDGTPPSSSSMRSENG